MSFQNLSLGKEALSQGATTGDAKLAGLPGRGTLQVWRGQSEDVIRIVGTWRLEEHATGLEQIREALASSSPMIYEGVLDDPAQVGRNRVTARVQVTSIASYRLGAQEDAPFCFVNFVPLDQKEVTGQ